MKNEKRMKEQHTGVYEETQEGQGDVIYVGEKKKRHKYEGEREEIETYEAEEGENHAEVNI